MKAIKHFKMLFLSLLFSFFALSVFGQVERENKLKYPGSETDLATAKATVKAYENGDWAKLRSNLKDDAIIHGLGTFDSLTVDETIAYWAKGRKTATPSLAENERWLAVSFAEGSQKGNWVFHWGSNTLTYQNGEKISFPYHVTMKMEDNKVVEAHFYYDNSKIIRGMGYAISPPVPENEVEDLEMEMECDEIEIEQNGQEIEIEKNDDGLKVEYD
ncbi:MAG TPA: nuclear transport factor 2 family protein [Salinimicrobium sp.]|nr:nuclear transport factor 2 family protein [Salinimicrobium sp.]